MALSANSVFEVRTGGSDTNGGGFVTGASGTNYSLQNSANSGTPNKSTTDAVATSSTTITSATAGFTSAIVGNIIYLQGGTGTLTAGWYQVATFVSATSITVDRTVAAGTGITMNIGGALLSPGQASAIMVTGNIVFCQNVGADGASIFSITVAAAGAGGEISTAAQGFFQGYTSTRALGNTDARPTFQLNVSTATMWAGGGALVVQGMICDGNSQTSAKAIGTAACFIRCMFKNFNVATSSSGAFLNCTFTTNSATIVTGGSAIRCEAFANTATPFTCIAIDCISSGNTGATTDGFTMAGTTSIISGCIAISNGRDGFHISNSEGFSVVNCHAESNTGFGFNITTAGKSLINCSAFGNTGGATNFTGNQSNVGFITVTAGSVFVAAGSNNYALNNTANQGALLRAAADPATFPRGLTANYRDIGAAQHQDSPSTTNVFVIDD